MQVNYRSEQSSKWCLPRTSFAWQNWWTHSAVMQEAINNPQCNGVPGSNFVALLQEEGANPLYWCVSNVTDKKEYGLWASPRQLLISNMSYDRTNSFLPSCPRLHGYWSQMLFNYMQTALCYKHIIADIPTLSSKKQSDADGRWDGKLHNHNQII